MKILVIDREEVSFQTMQGKLNAQEHSLRYEKSKTEALALLEQEPFDIIFIDPAPLNDARSILLNIRRMVKKHPYVVLMSKEDLVQTDAIKMGCNDLIAKPLDHDQVLQKIDNGKRLLELVQQIGDVSEDFPSAGGVISKSAFNQIFYSAIDRSDRYGDPSYILLIGIDNYQEIEIDDGQYAADYAASKMAQTLVQNKRKSDIVGQIGKREYALLILSPRSEDEPVEAAKRFAVEFSEASDLCNGTIPLKMHITLVETPSGHIPEHFEVISKPAV